MPIVYRCKGCGFVFFVFVYVGQDSYGPRTPSELVSMHGFRCPRCGRVLGKPSLDDIIVKPNGLEELEQVIEEARETMRISFRNIERHIAVLRRKLRRAVPRTAPATPAGIPTAAGQPSTATVEA